MELKKPWPTSYRYRQVVGTKEHDRAESAERAHDKVQRDIPTTYKCNVFVY